MGTINDRMFRSGEPGGGYGIASAMAWVYALCLGLALIVLLLITKERTGKQIAIQKTGEQIAIERMHAERAKNMKRKGGKKHGR